MQNTSASQTQMFGTLWLTQHVLLVKPAEAPRIAVLQHACNDIVPRHRHMPKTTAACVYTHLC